MTATHDELQKLADFDHVFVVTTSGTLSDVITEPLYAPEALDVDPSATELDGWQLPLSGLTGQYGYSGPWLHDSEIIPGGVAERVLSMPGYWVAIYASFSPTPEEIRWAGANAEPTIEGWTMAYRPFPDVTA